MRAIAGASHAGRVSIEPNPTPSPRHNDSATSGAQKGVQSSRQSFEEVKVTIEGDPDRPSFDRDDFSNGAIYVKIPGIIDVGDLPDGVSNVDIRA